MPTLEDEAQRLNRKRNIREQWHPGETATFEYSLAYDEFSDICTEFFPRNGQQVTVVEEEDGDGNRAEFPTFTERAEAGALVCYRVRFPDGHETSAFEDELLDPERPFLS